VAPRVTALVAESRGRVRIELDRPRARTLRRESKRLEALSVATGALSRRDHSVAGLAARLERRGVAPQERARTLETLERGGYVDDGRFAASRATLLAGRGYGDEAIRYDLERHGVAADPIVTALAALEPESRRARDLVARLGPSPKTARRLAAKGFSADTVEAALGDQDILGAGG
jgi:SOS response regulatory protein OraA/RecX